MEAQMMYRDLAMALAMPFVAIVVVSLIQIGHALYRMYKGE